MTVRSFKFVSLFFVLHLLAFSASKPSRSQINFFESKIRPILVDRCYECHNSTNKKKGGLILDSRDGLLKGGDSGSILDLKNPDQSLLMKVVRHDTGEEKMPKAGPKFSPAILADFKKWITMGAPDPRTKAPSAEVFAKLTSWEAIRERRKKWWSFQPIKDEKVPKTKTTWSAHPIDKFILAELERLKLKPAVPAKKGICLKALIICIKGFTADT